MYGQNNVGWVRWLPIILKVIARLGFTAKQVDLLVKSLEFAMKNSNFLQKYSKPRQDERIIFKLFITYFF